MVGSWSWLVRHDVFRETTTCVCGKFNYRTGKEEREAKGFLLDGNFSVSRAIVTSMLVSAGSLTHERVDELGSGENGD